MLLRLYFSSNKLRSYYITSIYVAISLAYPHASRQYAIS